MIEPIKIDKIDRMKAYYFGVLPHAYAALDLGSIDLNQRYCPLRMGMPTDVFSPSYDEKITQDTQVRLGKTAVIIENAETGRISVNKTKDGYVLTETDGGVAIITRDKIAVNEKMGNKMMATSLYLQDALYNPKMEELFKNAIYGEMEDLFRFAHEAIYGWKGMGRDKDFERETYFDWDIEEMLEQTEFLPNGNFIEEKFQEKKRENLLDKISERQQLFEKADWILARIELLDAEIQSALKDNLDKKSETISQYQKIKENLERTTESNASFDEFIENIEPDEPIEHNEAEMEL